MILFIASQFEVYCYAVYCFFEAVCCLSLLVCSLAPMINKGFIVYVNSILLSIFIVPYFSAQQWVENRFLIDYSINSINKIFNTSDII